MYFKYSVSRDLNSKRTLDLINKWANELNAQSSEEEIQMGTRRNFQHS
jgi:hypothetical protein